MEAKYKSDVVIIGGGPAGMLSAIYLDSLGISSIVLERQLEISSHPKAHELSARSIEILCQLGFTVEELKQEASCYRDASRILFGHTINQELGEIDLMAGGNDQKYQDHLASPEPYLNLSQTELEKLMRQKLLSCKKSQLFIGHQWEESQELDQGVISKVLNRETGKSFYMESQYVICADGAGSRSRKSLAIQMLGDEKIDDFISVYFELNLRDYLKKTAKLFWILNPAAPGTFIAHHIEKRWVYHFPIYTPYEKKEQYTEAVLKERILKALGDSSIPLEIESISFWRMTSQIAETFRKGRFFLVGDAAHRFPPTGGLGMNSGIGDVHNLCWKLAWVMQGKAGNSILDTYETERRPVIEQNSKESLRNYFKIWEVPEALGLNPKAIRWQAILTNSYLFKRIPKSWRATFLKRVYQQVSKKILAVSQQKERHQKVKKAIQDQMEHFDRIGLDLGYTYESGAIIVDPTETAPLQTVSTYEPSITPGVRFPHFWIKKGELQQSSHDYLHTDKFTLLTNDQGYDWWTQQAKSLSAELRSLLVVTNVEPLIKKAANTLPFYPIELVPLLLIRPDGQVAWKPKDLGLDFFSILNQLIRK